MRILFLNLYFPPDTSATAKSAESMVHALARTHEVTVLCGRPSYDPTERRPWKLWQTERLSTKNAQSIGETAGPSAATFTVIRVGSTDYPRIQMNRRILNYLTYSKLAAWRAFFIPCDVIFAMTDPPFNGIVAAVLSLLKRKPLLYDIQDMYPDMAVAGSIVQPGLLTRFWERVHRWALRRAARIIVLGDDMRARIIAKGPTGSNGIDPAKVFIVRSGVDTGLANSSILNPEVTRAIRGNFRFVLLRANSKTRISDLFLSATEPSVLVWKASPPVPLMFASCHFFPVPIFPPSSPLPTPTSSRSSEALRASLFPAKCSASSPPENPSLPSPPLRPTLPHLASVTDSPSASIPRVQTN